MTILIVTWVIFSFLVALFGATRGIGFSKSLLVSVILTPLVGIIAALLSKSKKDIAQKQKMDRLSKDYLDLIKPKK